MNRIGAIALVMTVALGFAVIGVGPTEASARTPSGSTVRIAIVSDAEWRLERTDDVLREELRALLEPEFEIEFPAAVQRNARRSDAPIPEIHAELLARDDVDLIIALGPRASQALLEVPRLDKPVFGTFVLDRLLQGFPITPQGTSGRRNLTYLVEEMSFGDLVLRLGSLFGAQKPERLAFLIDESFVTPELGLPGQCFSLIAISTK